MAMLTPGPIHPAMLSENNVPTTSASLDEPQSTDAGEGPSTPSAGITVSAGVIIDPLPSIAEDAAVPTTSSEASVPVRTLSTAETVRSERGEASVAANIARYQANRDLAFAEQAERDAAAAAARALQGGAEVENENAEDQSPAATMGRQGDDTGAAISTSTTPLPQSTTEHTMATLPQSRAESTPVSSSHSATEITTLASAQQIADDTTAASSPAQDVLQQTADNVTAAPISGLNGDSTVSSGTQTLVLHVENVADNALRSPMTDGAADIVSPTSAVSPTSLVSPTSTVVQSDASRQPSARPDMMLSHAPTVHGTEEARKSASLHEETFWEQLRACLNEWCCMRRSRRSSRPPRDRLNAVEMN